MDIQYVDKLNSFSFDGNPFLNLSSVFWKENSLYANILHFFEFSFMFL